MIAEHHIASDTPAAHPDSGDVDNGAELPGPRAGASPDVSVAMSLFRLKRDSASWAGTNVASTHSRARIDAGSRQLASAVTGGSYS